MKLAVVASYVSAATGVVAYLAFLVILLKNRGDDELSPVVYPLLLLAVVPAVIGRLLVVAADSRPTAHTVAKVLASAWAFAQFVLVVTAAAAVTDDGDTAVIRAMEPPVIVFLGLHLVAQFVAMVVLVLPGVRRYRDAVIAARPAPSLVAGRRWIIVAIVLFAVGVLLAGAQIAVWQVYRSGTVDLASGYYGGIEDEATTLLIFGAIGAVGGLILAGGTALALPGFNWARRLVFFFGRWGIVTASTLFGLALLFYYDGMEFYLDDDATLNAVGQGMLALGFVQLVVFSAAVALVGTQSGTAWVKRKAGPGGPGVPAFAGQFPPPGYVQPGQGYPAGPPGYGQPGSGYQAPAQQPGWPGR
ncbi:hypothetical protein SAMN05443668_1275 [Cryptosporangium aurantiacum]|uniref:Uncharacterized protein n=1 Tax=Cryptosporangium aurantiacum TaxID=134849 RepID=A0A1M7RNN2_9ACTN|nr:hypothetical protein SAMN05443668_1275 [Cryptosporangium aurantiacum]